MPHANAIALLVAVAACPIAAFLLAVAIEGATVSTHKNQFFTCSAARSSLLWIPNKLWPISSASTSASQ
jgi:hypothetical protein